MTLDVSVPDPPRLESPPVPADYDEEVTENPQRRETLASYLEEGAWRDGFSEWAEYTDLTEDEFTALHERGLIDALDFYWDPVHDDVTHHVPSVPAELGDTATVSRLEAELDYLGRAVSEVLEADYVGREGGSEFFAEE